MTENLIQLPSLKTIEEWQHVDDIHFVETTPRSVPLSSLIAYPEQEYIDRIVSLKSGIPAAKHIQHIKDLLHDVTLAKRYLVEIYTKRGLMKPISSDQMMNMLMNNTVSAQTAQTMFEDLVAYFTKEKEDMSTICQNISRLLYSDSLWSNGQYSDYFIDVFCETIFTLNAIENLQPSKKSVNLDLSQLSKIAKGAQQGNAIDNSQSVIRMWLATPNAITEELLQTCLNNVNYQRIELVTQILTDYIRYKIENRNYLDHNQKFFYISALKFIVALYNRAYQKEQIDKKGQKKKMFVLKPISDEITAMTKTVLEAYKLMPYIFEYAVETADRFDKSYITLPKKANIKNPINFPRKKLQDLQQEAHKHSAVLTQFINELNSCQKINASQKVETPDELCKKLVHYLPKVIQTNSMTMGIVREVVIQKQMTVPTDPNRDPNISDYEAAILAGLNQDAALTILNVLWLAKSTKELISLNYPVISQAISDAIQNDLQDFAVNILPQSILRNSEYKEDITNIIEVIRTLLGYFPNGDHYEISAKKASKVETVAPSKDIGTPHIAMIELLRTQLQLFVNPDAPAVSKLGVFKGQPLDSDDEKIFKEFIERSQYYIPLLNLMQTLDQVCDQSFLYYKEYFLDVNKRTFFPVTTSIPVILSRYSLERYNELELTGAIFYPLSIYDDAAASALKYLKSKYLFDEIRAEASICVQYISREIAHQAMKPILKFAALQFMPKSVVESLPDNMLMIEGQKFTGGEIFKENISSLRLGLILQQNTLTILGCPIDTKTLIADNLNQLLHDHLKQLVGLIEQYGLFFVPMFVRIIEILRRTHELLSTFELKMNPFDDILRLAMVTDNPNSFQSGLLNSIYSHIESVIVPDCAIFTFPMRILPHQENHIGEQICKIFDNNIGAIFNAYLIKTTHIVSIESLREMLWLMEDGAPGVFSMLFNSLLDDLSKPFLQVYQSVRGNLARINNPPASATYAQAFDIYEGAYHYFIDNAEVRTLLSLMNQIGNILILSQFLDNAVVLKRTTTALASSFILSTNPIDSQEKVHDTPELFEMFDGKFQETKPFFSNLAQKIGDDEIELPILSASVRALVTLLLPEFNLFAESSPNLCDLQSQKGFAALYSALEFILINIMIAETKTTGGYGKYGDGIFYFAAALLNLCSQRRLFRALSITEKLIAHSSSDLGTSLEERTMKFVTASKYASASLASASATLQPILNNILQK